MFTVTGPLADTSPPIVVTGPQSVPGNKHLSITASINTRMNLKPIVTVTWDNGVLSGDAAAVALVRAVAAELQGERVGPVEGPYTTTANLDSALSALMIIADVFADDAVFTGDVPERPAIPPGAIG